LSIICGLLLIYLFINFGDGELFLELAAGVGCSETSAMTPKGISLKLFFFLSLDELF